MESYETCPNCVYYRQTGFDRQCKLLRLSVALDFGCRRFKERREPLQPDRATSAWIGERLKELDALEQVAVDQ